MTQMERLEKIIAFLEKAESFIDSFTVQAVSDELDELAAVDIALKMGRLKEANERADDLKKAIGKVYDHVRTIALPDRMDDEGLENMKVQGLGRISVTSDLRASIVDKEAGYRWLEEHGHGDLITETVNASSLKATIRRMIRDGEEIPDEIFKVTAFNRASITKA